VYLFLDIN